MKNIVKYANILNTKVISFIRRIGSVKVDAHVAPDNKEVGKLQGKYIVENYNKLSKKYILILQRPNTDKNSEVFYLAVFDILSNFNTCKETNCQSIVVDNWDASNVKEIILHLSPDFKDNLGFVCCCKWRYWSRILSPV